MKTTCSLLLVLTALAAAAQTRPPSQLVTATIDASKTGPPVSPYVYVCGKKMPNRQISRLTVYKDIKMIFQALKAGACCYVLKRSDDKEIPEAIAEVRAGGAPMTSEIARMAEQDCRG